MVSNLQGVATCISEHVQILSKQKGEYRLMSHCVLVRQSSFCALKMASIASFLLAFFVLLVSLGVQSLEEVELNKEIYCFPSTKTYSWKEWELQKKEGHCGPHLNQFNSSTISIVNDMLLLSFKQVDTVWSASEVRLFHKSNDLGYGTYSFSISRIAHVNAEGDLVSENFLPPSLILGMFTWDPYEEDGNHEVDVEVSRWGSNQTNDAQFVVQPADPIQRFDTQQNQSGVYSFEWLPTSIYFAHDKGVEATLSTTLGRPDPIECLPAQVELRLNLWNLGGSEMPLEMNEGDEIRVLVDEVTYAPSSETHVAVGDSCSKDCQCEGQCVGGVCMDAFTLSPSGETVAACMVHERCRGKLGDCCPNEDGIMMDCCVANE